MQITDWYEKLIINLASQNRGIDDIAVFSNSDPDEESFCYFSPGAVQHAGPFLSKYRASPVEPPHADDVMLVCGVHSAWTWLPGSTA